MSFDHKQTEQGGGVESSAPPRAPGKTTLTQRLPAVQRQVPDGDDGENAAHVYDTPGEDAAHVYDTPAEGAGDAATAAAFEVASGGIGAGSPFAPARARPSGVWSP